MGRDGTGMTTQDWDPRGPFQQDWDPRDPSTLRGSLSGPTQMPELVREAYGLPIQNVPTARHSYQPSPAARSGIVSVGLAMTSLVMFRYRVGLSLFCGIVSAGLGITDVVAYNSLSGYVAYPGMAVGLLTFGLRRNAEKKTTGPEPKGRRIALRIAVALGMLGFLLLVTGTGHGDALNNAGLSSR
jgi:hypothetical protein